MPIRETSLRPHGRGSAGYVRALNVESDRLLVPSTRSVLLEKLK
jgi:hypothetical protein